MQARRVGDGNRAGEGLAPAAGRCAGLRRGGLDRGGQGPSADHHPGFGPDRADRVHIGHDHLGEQAFRLAGHPVDVEGYELVAGVDFVAPGDVGREPASFQADGFKADVDEDLDPLRCAYREGVMGVLEIGDLSRNRSEYRAVERVDGESIADHLLCEDGIGNAFDRHHDTGQRGKDLDMGRLWTHGGSPSFQGSAARLLDAKSMRLRAI